MLARNAFSRQSRFTALIFAGAVLASLVGGAGCKKDEPQAPPQPQIPTYTQKRVLGRVDWPASSTISQTALAAMKPEARAKISSSGVPVLVPNDPVLLNAGTTDQPDEAGYGFGAGDPVGGITFTVDASRASTQSNAPVPAYLYDKNRPDDRVIAGSRKVAVSRISGDGDAGPWTANWMDYGEVAYSVVLICVDPNDPRCADDTYVRSFVASLVYVGGAGKQ